MRRPGNARQAVTGAADRLNVGAARPIASSGRYSGPLPTSAD
jgi:hypothetical protein